MNVWEALVVHCGEVKLKESNLVGEWVFLFKILILHFGKWFNNTKQTVVSSRFARQKYFFPLLLFLLLSKHYIIQSGHFE